MPTPTQRLVAPKIRPAPLPPTDAVEAGGEGAATLQARNTAASRPYPYPEEELQRELDEQFALYETLEPGWDMYSADPTNMDSLSDARKFLKNRPKDVPLPFPQIGSDGIVGLYWQTDGTYVSVAFEGNGLLCYYTEQSNPGGKPRELLADDIPFNEGWPQELLGVLRCL